MKVIVFLLAGTIILTGCATINQNHKIDHRSKTNHYSENTKDYVPQFSPEQEKQIKELAGIDKRVAFAIIIDEDGDGVVIAPSQTKSAEIFPSSTFLPAKSYRLGSPFAFAEHKRSHCYALGLQSRYYQVRGTTVEICVAH